MFKKCENKGTDKLRGYLSLYVHYIERAGPLQSLPEILNPLTIFYCCSVRFVSDLFGNPGDRFSLAKAHAMFLQGVCQK